MTKIDELTAEFEVWARANGVLNAGDATEILMFADLTEAQRTFVRDFIERWEAAAAEDPEFYDKQTVVRTPAQIERARVEALPEGSSRTFALNDLAMTPGARFAGVFLGETFYGVTTDEVLLKVEECIKDAGFQPTAEDACQPYQLPEA